MAPLAAAVAKDPTVVSWREYASESALLEAAIMEAGGDPAGALRLDGEVLRQLARGHQPVVNTYALWLLEQARLQSGDDLIALRRPLEAHARWLAVGAGSRWFRGRH